MAERAPGAPGRLVDGLLARALMSVQTVKGVEVGLGFGAARLRGSEMHDEIVLKHGPETRWCMDCHTRSKVTNDCMACHV